MLFEGNASARLRIPRMLVIDSAMYYVTFHALTDNVYLHVNILTASCTHATIRQTNESCEIVCLI